MSDTSNPTPSWQLPPAPGQYGYKPQPDQAAIPREPPDQSGPPYGFRGGRSLVPYTPTGQNPALRDRPPGDWGSPDWVLAGMENYPDGGTPEGMHVPGEHDILPNVHNSAMFWGRFGPPGLAMPSIAAARYGAAAQQGYAKGQREAAQLNHQQMIDALALKKYRYGEMMDQYGHAYTAYGPKPDDEGNIEEFYKRIEMIAREHGDTTVLHMLEQGDWRSIDNLMRSYDSQGQDDSKTLKLLQIEAEKLRIEEQKQKIEDANRKRRDAEAAMAPYRLTPGGTAGATPAAPGPAPAAPANPALGSPEDMGPAPEGSTTTPEMFDPTHPPQDTDGDTPVATPPAAEPAGAGAGGGTGADAAPAAAAPAADLAAGARAAGAPVMAADDEPDQPSAAPAGAPAAGAAAAAPPYQMLPSDTLAAARRNNINPAAVDQLGRQAADRQLSIADFRNLPPALRPYVGARAQEISREYDRILKDPKITGERVYDAIKTFDPGFADTLRAYVDGKAPPPASAWQNPVYRDRVVGLGNKVDNTFTYLTFKNRAATLASFSHGQDHRNLLAVGTAERHIQGLLDSLPDKPGIGRPIFDVLRNKWIEWVQDPNKNQQWLAAWETNSDIAANEIARATSGAAPHQTEIDFWKNELGAHRNAAQLAASLNRARSLVGSRLNELKSTYDAAMGRDPVAGISRLLNQDIARAGTPADERADDLAVLKALQRPQASASPAGADEVRKIGNKTYYKRNGEWHDE